MSIPDPRQRPTMPLWPDVAEAFNLGRSSVYALAAQDALPVKILTLGRRRVVATAELRRVLGLDVMPGEPARDGAEALPSLRGTAGELCERGGGVLDGEHADRGVTR